MSREIMTCILSKAKSVVSRVDAHRKPNNRWAGWKILQLKKENFDWVWNT